MGSRYLYLSKWGSGSRRRRRCYRPAVAAAAAAAAAASAAAARSVTKMMMDRQARTLPGPCLSPCQDHGAAPRRCTGLGALRTGLRDLVLWRARQPVLLARAPDSRLRRELQRPEERFGQNWGPLLYV